MCADAKVFVFQLLNSISCEKLHVYVYTNRAAASIKLGVVDDCNSISTNYTKQPLQHLKPIKSWVHGKLPATEKYTAPSLALFLSDPTYRGLTAASYACLSLLFTQHVAAARNIDI